MDREQIRARAVLSDLLDCNEGLSAREIDFLDDINNKQGFIWTEKQIAWLDKIFDRVC